MRDQSGIPMNGDELIAIDGEIVHVQYENYLMPFSKGILAQSLTSIGFNEYQAYFVGQTIENNLREKKTLLITQKELETLTYNVLLKNFPKDAANNYLMLRRFLEQKIPLVIILGGATAVGKSTISSTLASRFGIRHVFGTDIVREAMRSVITPEMLPELHASSYSAWKRLGALKAHVENKIIVGFEEQAQHVMSGVEGIVNRSLIEGISVIIEGVHVCPQLLSPQLLEKPNVIIIFLKLCDRDAHMSRIFARSENVVVKRPPTQYIEHFDEIRKIQDHITSQAEELGLPVIENTNQAETVMTIITLILNRIKTLVKKK